MTDSSSDPLLAGYRRFRAHQWPRARAAYETLAEAGQTPHTLFLACSDSRADPALIFDAAPGDLFVVRNVANLVPPYAPDGGLHGVSSALEFGVKALKVSRIVVMGHALCGGVQAMRSESGAAGLDFVEAWVDQGRPTVRQALASCDHDHAVQVSEEAIVKLSLDNLRTFPWIAEREAAGELTLTGLHFGIADGVLRVLGDDGAFRPA
ncbi:carbonic anhydrase [Brevundimonas sp.]|uniref:carbonic anhydrase n=1 Tax=Brevundimonas sp. TaxID=1871086 RepID=UPI003AF932DF